MENKKKNMVVIILFLVVSLILLGLVFVNRAFLSAFMLWLSLFIFSICFYIKDGERKWLLYSLFVLGVILIILALGYMLMRIM